ncbi:hypothetical protein GDO78_010849 [Eleutherodactylus coqui]|uniref:Secreted protein n=1 Tax=Eleutherodactylus coqui TaxID=57060 RepID=A0A8J6F7B3_ELECQ|nr:hypothetical protein GDO78_010849 [Eleutherodactylus coqui]
MTTAFTGNFLLICSFFGDVVGGRRGVKYCSSSNKLLIQEIPPTQPILFICSVCHPNIANYSKGVKGRTW